MNSMLGIAVGICGAAFIGYCIYFDNKRRNHPNFKKKLRERRQAAAARKEVEAMGSQIPTFKDNDSLQRYFLREVQMSEECLIHGELAAGVKHLTNAVVVCRQPQHLLNILSTTLPPQVFQMLLKQLVKMEKQKPVGPPTLIRFGWTEEDVE